MTTGRVGRRRAGLAAGLLMCCLLPCCLLVGACGSADSLAPAGTGAGPSAGTGTAAGASAGTGASAGSSGTGTSAGTAGPATSRSARPSAARSRAGRPLAVAPQFCARRPAGLLRAELARAVPRSRRDEFVPLGASADGRTAYVSAWTRSFAGVAELDLASGRLRPIQRFADPASDQADGSADGRWLVWEETFSLQNLDDFAVYSWDAATGRLRRLGHSLSGPGGTPWPSPWHAPAVSGHYAAWAQGYGPGGLVEIRMADLRTGRVTVIHKGHVQPPFFDGGLVVWPESDRPGTQTTLHAYRLATGRPAALPPVLRFVHGTEFVATDGTRTAYLSPDLTGLYYSPSPTRRARLVLRLPLGQQFAGLEIGAGTLAWTTSRATYVASTRTGGYVQVTPQYGDATGAGRVLLVSDPAARPPTSQRPHPGLALHVVRAAAVTWPTCATPAGRSGR